MNRYGYSISSFVALAVIVLLSLNASGQSIDRDVIASAGDYFQTPDFTLSWTIGEPVVETIANQDVTLTQGFQQATITLTSIKEPLSEQYAINVYPNPTVDRVNIQLQKPGDEIIMVQMYDMNGELMINNKYQNESLIQLDLSRFATANYLLSLRRLTGELITTFIVNKTK